MGNMLNACESLGLGSIWIHRAKEVFEKEFGKSILKDLNITGDYEGIGFCAIGYMGSVKNPLLLQERKIIFIILNKYFKYLIYVIQ